MRAVNDKPVLWTAAEVAGAVRSQGGAVSWCATGVSIDSRTVVPGDLFVALEGPTFDGHDFLEEAFGKGAVAALVSRPPQSVGNPLVIVDDTMKALEALGQAARARSQATVIAITGSVGKTGTKAALAQCLGEQAPTYATEGNLNNHWGVPLSLARLPADCRYGVFELGMNHAGEIGPLARQVRPDVGVITNIQPAHMEFFGSLDEVADAKAELFQGMATSGIAVLNRDNGQFERLAASAAAHGIQDIRDFGGYREDRPTWGLPSSADPTGSLVTAKINGTSLSYRISLPGRHWVNNSLAVLSAVQAAGADLQAAARSLGRLVPVKGRGSRRHLPLTHGSFTLIDESYNASPAAMTAAFQVLADTDPGAGGRRIAVLGDMLELGEQSDAYHAALAEPLAESRVDLVFGCGRHTAALMPGLPAAIRGAWTEDSTGLAPLVAGAVRSGDVVLVKGSAGSRMARVVAALAGVTGEALSASASASAASAVAAG